MKAIGAQIQHSNTIRLQKNRGSQPRGIEVNSSQSHSVRDLASLNRAHYKDMDYGTPMIIRSRDKKVKDVDPRAKSNLSSRKPLDWLKGMPPMPPIKKPKALVRALE